MWSKGNKIRRRKKTSHEAATRVQERKQENKDSAGKDEEDETGSRIIRRKRWIWSLNRCID